MIYQYGPFKFEKSNEVEKVEALLKFAGKYESEWELFIDKLKHSKQILVFTGAGISVNSGIPDFRSCDNIYSKSDPKMVLIGIYLNVDPQ
ncbi:NAD-dependent histone deacetylase sir2 [Globomyces sp. JEL0801]|nr:NAD-dependent histone deacetylase sir2 [Globomyces sp. JEL0801]